MFTSLQRLHHAVRSRDHTQKPTKGTKIKESCRFCDVSVSPGFDIVHEDDIFVAFRDRNPSSVHHIQLITKTHIDSVQSLSTADIDLVKSMERIGHDILDSLDVPPHQRKLGFHIPPFNSVQHLHLHLQGLPYKSLVRRMKYPVVQGGKGSVKGFSWFVNVSQLIELLERRRCVRVMPC
ncbi:HIT domain protein [Pleurotus ostreatus PC15]|uniref:HIT domain protein n=1 Tax=Pleurotus ostreatus (strain PC15) TaxID=1137138 RepID=A0A067N9S0_PLEO1|nr:HIT domain protein [Pleurotus ostreatus PC15]